MNSRSSRPIQAELERIAREFGVTPADLDRLVRHGPHGADELPIVLEALGIDEAAIRRAEPSLLRDMERVCSFCKHKRECHRELAAGTAPANYEAYSANADIPHSLPEPCRLRARDGINACV